MVKKQKKFVEEHFDDCGEDLAGLGEGVVVEGAYWVNYDKLTDLDPVETFEDTQILVSEMLGLETLPLWLMMGQDMHLNPMEKLTYISTCNLTDSLKCMDQLGEKKACDIVQVWEQQPNLCLISLRKQLGPRQRFSMRAACDLSDPKERESLKSHCRKHQVMLVVMALCCWTTTGQNAVAQQCCGEIALDQLQQGRHFVREQRGPGPITQAWLSEQEPWPQVYQHTSVTMTGWNRCAMGATNCDQTALLASHQALTNVFEQSGCMCNGTRPDTCQRQPWTWEEAQRVVAGLTSVLCHQTNSPQQLKRIFSYPETGTDAGPPSGTPHKHVPRKGCPGCLRGRASQDTDSVCCEWMRETYAFDMCADMHFTSIAIIRMRRTSS